MTARSQQILHRLAQAYGAAQRRYIVSGRSDRRAVAALIRAGEVELHAGSVIALPGTPREVIVARACHGLVTCAHALERAGFPLRNPCGTVHVVCASSPHVRPPRVRLHRVPAMTCDPLGDPYADVETVLLTYLRCAAEIDAVIAIDAALAARAVTKDALVRRLRGGRNRPLRATVMRCTDRARSLLESIARYELEEAGARPRPGVPSPAGELDLVLGSLDIETDGYAYHHDLAAWTNDRIRDQVLARHGYTVLRLTARQVLAGYTVSIVKPVAQRLNVWHAAEVSI